MGGPKRLTLIAKAIGRFPKHFGLIDYPGETFRIDPARSHYGNDGKGGKGPRLGILSVFGDISPKGLYSPEDIRMNLMPVPRGGKMRLAHHAVSGFLKGHYSKLKHRKRS
jgi:hypothetical protein